MIIQQFYSQIGYNELHGALEIWSLCYNDHIKLLFGTQKVELNLLLYLWILYNRITCFIKPPNLTNIN